MRVGHLGTRTRLQGRTRLSFFYPRHLLFKRVWYIYVAVGKGDQEKGIHSMLQAALYWTAGAIFLSKHPVNNSQFQRCTTPIFAWLIRMPDLSLEYSYICFAHQMQTFGIECKVIDLMQIFGIESSTYICKLKTKYRSTQVVCKCMSIDLCNLKTKYRSTRIFVNLNT